MNMFTVMGQEILEVVRLLIFIVSSTEDDQIMST